jgi:hypothetical protein
LKLQRLATLGIKTAGVLVAILRVSGERILEPGFPAAILIEFVQRRSHRREIDLYENNVTHGFQQLDQLLMLSRVRRRPDISGSCGLRFIAVPPTTGSVSQPQSLVGRSALFAHPLAVCRLISPEAPLEKRAHLIDIGGGI